MAQNRAGAIAGRPDLAGRPHLAGRRDFTEHTRVASLLFALAVTLAVAMPWLAPRPPMVDLPQHAAQVALWRDLLAGGSPWADLVGINLLTPYLIGYGAMLPLAALLPAVVAAKLVLSAAVLGFVVAGRALRRAVEADARLDWLIPVGLFGYAWQWGFLTFLAAAPLGLWLLAVAVRQGAAPGRRGAAAILALGLACLFAHALVFLMAGGLGGLLALRGIWQRRGRGAFLALAPWAALLLALVALRAATAGDTAGFHADGVVFGPSVLLRPVVMLGYVTDSDGEGLPLPRPALLLLLALPLVLRLPRNRNGGAWLFGGLVALLLALPFYAFETAGLVNRFTLFLPAFFPLLFGRGGAVGERRATVALALGAAGCFGLIGLAALRTVSFGAEAAAFEPILAAAPPGRRALALVADPASPAADNAQAYRHWPSWYGAEKGGFVDFNFAGFPPQVVRFRPGRGPSVTATVGWFPERYDWSKPEARLYELVFVRGGPAFVEHVRRASPCGLTPIATSREWTLLERGTCP